MKKDLTYKLRKNPYIVSTFALALFCLLVVVGNIIEAKSIDGTENENETFPYPLITEERQIEVESKTIFPSYIFNGVVN